MTEIHTLYDESGDTMSVSEIRSGLMRANQLSISTHNYEDEYLLSQYRGPRSFIRMLPEVRLYGPVRFLGIVVLDREDVFGDRWIEAMRRLLRRHGFLRED